MVMVSHAVRCLDFRAIRGSIVVLVHDLLFTELIALSVDPGTQVARRPAVAIPMYIGRGCCAAISYIPRRSDARFPGYILAVAFQLGDG